MNTFAAVLAFALCNSAILAQGSRVQPRSALTDVLNSIINKSRPLLKDLQIALIDLQDQGNITDATLQNLDTFVVTETTIGNALALEVKKLAVDIDVLRLFGKFLFIDLNLPAIGTVSGSGSIDANLRTAKISASLKFTFKGLSLVVKDISNVAVSVASADAVFDGIDAGLAEAVNGALTEIVPISIPKLIEDNKASIIAWMNENLL